MICAELVKRLRSCAFTGVSNQQVVYVDKSALEQAADCIEALTAEREKVWDEAVWAVAQVVDQEMARIGFIGDPDRFGRRAEMRNVIAEELKSVQSMRAEMAEIKGEKT